MSSQDSDNWNPSNFYPLSLLTRRWAKSINLPVHFEASVPSTNTWALQEGLPSIDQPELYLTDDQPSGRGRKSRRWLNAGSGTALPSSWVFSVLHPPQPILSPLIGEAVFASSSAIWPELPWSLKAPNDLYLGAKKIAGLLIENQVKGSSTKVVVGFGFNVLASPQLDPGSSLQAGHLLELTSNYDESIWSQFLAQFFQRLQTALQEANEEEFSDGRRIQLLKALRSHPTEGARISDLLPRGDLMIDGKKLGWMDI